MQPELKQQTHTNTDGQWLLCMKEEKLAGNVYDSLYDKWQQNPFGSIRQSEQRHINRMQEMQPESIARYVSPYSASCT